MFWGTSMVAQMVKRLPTMRETQVQFLGRKDLLEKGMVTHCLMRRVDSLEKTLMLGGIWGRRKRGRQRMRWLDGITDSMDVSGSRVNSGSW